MSQFMNLNFGIPLQNMNQQFINQNRMNMNMFTQNNIFINCLLISFIG